MQNKIVKINFGSKEDTCTDLNINGSILSKKATIDVIKDLKSEKCKSSMIKFGELCKFSIVTKEGEKVTILLNQNDPYYEDLLKLNNQLLVKKIAIYAAIAVLGTGSLVMVNNPKVQQTITQTLDKIDYNNEKQSDFALMDGYYIRLSGNNLSNADYDEFQNLVYKYTGDTKNSDDERELLEKYSSLLSKTYNDEMVSRHSK